MLVSSSCILKLEITDTFSHLQIIILVLLKLIPVNLERILILHHLFFNLQHFLRIRINYISDYLARHDLNSV